MGYKMKREFDYISYTNRVVAKILSIIVLIFLPLTIFHLNVSLMNNLFLIGGLTYFYIIPKITNNKYVVKNLLLVGVSFYYPFIFVLLNSHNSSVPYMYFIGLVISIMYLNKLSIILYSVSLVIFNSINYCFFSEVFYINHTTTNWMFMFLMYTICVFISLKIVSNAKTLYIELE